MECYTTKTFLMWSLLKMDFSLLAALWSSAVLHCIEIVIYSLHEMLTGFYILHDGLSGGVTPFYFVQVQMKNHSR